MKTLTLPLAVGCALLSGCQNTGLRPADPTSDAVFLELPRLSQQEVDRCGVVSVAILTSYYGVELPEEERLWLDDRARRNAGLSGDELCRVLREAGMGTELFAGTRADLRAHIDAGRPVLAMISLDGEKRHYCLVNGYEPGGDVLYVFEPRRGQLSVSAGRFEEMWERSRHFSLVAAPDIVARTAPVPELGELRAGDITFTDHELKIIGITALGVLILVLIL